MKQLFFVYILLLFARSTHAQTKTLSSPTSGTVSASTKIILTSGFRSIPYFRAYISGGLGIGGGSLPSQDQNYVLTNTFRRPISQASSAFADLNVGDVSQTIKYFDGLGRLSQIVQTKGSPKQNDLVQPIVYDIFGRAVRTLPSTSLDGRLRLDVSNLSTGKYIVRLVAPDQVLTKQIIVR